MHELYKFIKQYQEKTFNQVLEENEVEKKDIKQFENINIKASTVNEEQRTVEIIATSETEDRQGDIVKIAGAQLENFIKNPVILFGHDYSALPVAKAIGIKVEGKQIIMKIQFPTKEVYDFADIVFKMVKSGYLNTVSIGFIPIKQAYDEELKAYVIEKWEMLETSIVPVPANQDALIRGFNGFQKYVDLTKVDEELEKAEAIEEKEKEEELEEARKEALKLYRKYQVKLREVLGIDATENELEVIKEVFDSALGICRVLKNKSNVQEETTLEDNNDDSNVSETHEQKSLVQLANSLY